MTSRQVIEGARHKSTRLIVPAQGQTKIRQLTTKLEQREKELTQLRREMSKEAKINEELGGQAMEAEDNVKTLQRSNQQLKRDVEFLRAELDKEMRKKKLVPCFIKKNVETQNKLDLANSQLQQHLEDLQRVKDANFVFETSLEVAVEDMNMMADKYVKMSYVNNKLKTDSESFIRERDDVNKKVRNLEDKIQNMIEEEGKAEQQWKKVLTKKDKEIIYYQREIHLIKEKLISAKLELDESYIVPLHQAVQDRDIKIKRLCEAIDQYTRDMEKLTQLIEELKISINKDRGIPKSRSLMEEDVGCMEKDEIIRRISIYLERAQNKWEQKTTKNIFEAAAVKQESHPSNTSINVNCPKKPTKATDVKTTTGQSELAMDVNLEVHHLLGLNEELRQELKLVQEEAESHLNKLDRANEKITQANEMMAVACQEKQRTDRELLVQKEETKKLKNLVEENEKTICLLEKDIEQQNMRRTESGAAFKEAVHSIESKDKMINELNLELCASQSEFQQARQIIQNLKCQLDQNSDVLNKHQNLLLQATQVQEDLIKSHQKELERLHQILDSQKDTSLDSFKQIAKELMDRTPIQVITSKQLEHLSELEETVAERVDSLSSLTKKLKETTAELERQRTSMERQAKKHQAETEDQRSQMAQMEERISCLQTELAAQKEDNVFSPSNTMIDTVESLKAQLTQKNKQIKTLCKALLELRAKMTSDNDATRKEERNVQVLVERQTNYLKAQVEELNKELQVAKDSTKAARGQDKSLQEELEGLKHRVQRNQYTERRLQAEKEKGENEIQELKQYIKKLTSDPQNNISGLKQMCSKLRREKEKMEERMGHICEEDYSGRTVAELEKSVGMLRKLVGRLQDENKSLKIFRYV